MSMMLIKAMTFKSVRLHLNLTDETWKRKYILVYYKKHWWLVAEDDFSFSTVSKTWVSV